MAQTKRKRRTKHRGNAAGIVEVRGKTHKGGTSGATKKLSARDDARQRRLSRLDRPPTWRSAAQRAGIAAIIFVALVVVAFGRPIAEALALGGFVLLFYIPLGYFTDLAMYRARQRRKEKQAGQR
jgi:hypothetical protein